MRILIVDDSPLIWRRLFDMLQELSFVSLLFYARNLAEARHCLDGCVPDLVILDIALPDGNGLDLLRHLQSAELDTRVALFTNSTDLRVKGLAMGADWFFDKSLDFSQLLDLIKDRAYWLNLIEMRGGYAHADG